MRQVYNLQYDGATNCWKTPSNVIAHDVIARTFSNYKGEHDRVVGKEPTYKKLGAPIVLCDNWLRVFFEYPEREMFDALRIRVGDEFEFALVFFLAPFDENKLRVLIGPGALRVPVTMSVYAFLANWDRMPGFIMLEYKVKSGGWVDSIVISNPILPV